MFHPLAHARRYVGKGLLHTMPLARYEASNAYPFAEAKTQVHKNILRSW
jgi:hypothetical protein